MKRRMHHLLPLSALCLSTVNLALASRESDHQVGDENYQSQTEERHYIPGASGSGPFEALKDWIAAFEAKYPEADLSVSSVGSGAAQSALWGDIDCAKKPVEGICEDGGDETTESESTENLLSKTFWGMGGGTFDSEHYIDYEELGLQQLPALGGPILVTYSKDVTGDLGATTSEPLNMSFWTVAGIFSNSIVRWNDPAIQADNPAIASELPSDRITVVVRSDKSGMSQTFTEAIHHANPATWPEDAVGKTPTWPLANLTHSTESGMSAAAGSWNASDDVPLNFKADGQTGIGISLLRQPYSVGYLELGYFSTLTQFVAQAHVSSPAHPTSFVPATVETLKKTMGGLAGKLEPETLSLTLVDQDTPEGGYPISRYVYWYIKKDAGEYESCYQAWLVYKFIEWTYTDPLAEEIALGHGWVVPPESVVELALTKLQEIKCIDNDTTNGDDDSPSIILVSEYIPVPYREAVVDDDDNDLIAILIPTMLISLLIAVAIVCYFYIEKKKRHADAVWMVKKSELDFGGTLDLIGRGTFGTVALAEYRGTKVAVKQVKPLRARPSKDSDVEVGATSNPGLISVATSKSFTSTSGSSYLSGGLVAKKLQYYRHKSDFVKEMRRLAKLRHPNITTTMGAVLEAGEEPMLVMEYMHNGSLYDAIRNETINLNSHEDILTIVQDIAHGIRFLHSANPQVIHGDLKTKNVLIDANFRAKVADFGLSSTSRKVACGTPYWMAPELLTGASTNNSMSDVYAFGILLYEVYSRKDPYEGEDYKEVIRQVCDPSICKQPPVPASCPKKIASLMSDCLQRNPLDRPSGRDIDSSLQSEGTIQGRVFRIEAMNKELAESKERIMSEQATQLGHFASMSHEIRTPLNCVIGISSLLEDDDDLNVAQRDSVKMIVSSGKLLRQVVDDVLDFSKFVSGKGEIDVKRTNLQETLSNIITSMNMSPITERKQISVRTFYDPLVPQFIETDGRRLQQILYNLLSNAVKFSKVNGKVDLSVSVGSRFQNGTGNVKITNETPKVNNQRQEIRISVKDCGKGIDKSEFGKIFQPFAQTKSGITNVDGGTGLGLAITKQLTELLGGSISVDSKVDEWTMFSLRFPLTVSAVDARTVTSRLSRCGVWLVSNRDDETKYIADACKHFKVEHHHCKILKELQENFNSLSSSVRAWACIVQEDLYDETIYEDISKRRNLNLLTFGPKGKIKKAKVHYQSLMQVFPSVLMQEFDSLCNFMSPTRCHTLTHKQSEKTTDIISFEGLKILVAEDNLVNQKVMVRLLERLGVRNVQVAGNGQIALDQEAAESFDIVFMDIEMPIMNGTEACERIVDRTDTPPRVVFLSAHVLQDYEAMCNKHGATDYLTKPCTLDDVRKMLEKLVNLPYGGM